MENQRPIPPEVEQMARTILAAEHANLFFHPGHKFTDVMEELIFHIADCLECKTGLSFMVRFLLDEFPVLKGGLLMAGIKESDITNSLLSANREILEEKLKGNEQWQRFKNLANTGSV